MNVILREVNAEYTGDVVHLFNLLAEREPWQSISHKEMPVFEAHVKFVESEPYKAWYLIYNFDGEVVGCTYLTHDTEIGITIYNKYSGKGYAKAAVQKLMSKHEGPFLANINPANAPSRWLFERLGFEVLQVTYISGEKNVPE